MRSQLAALTVAIASSACASSLPSKEPLGVGPLSPHYHLGTNGKPRREDRVAKTEPPKEAARVESATAPPPEERPRAGEAAARSNGGASTEKAAEETTLDPALFLGDYRGDDVSTYHLSGMPERADKDPNARVNVTSSEKKSVDVVLVDSSNGKDICTLNATLGTSAATITPGQKCFEQNTAEESAAATVRSGTVTVDGKTLVLDLSADFEMHVPDQDVTGSLDYHFEGRRR